MIVFYGAGKLCGLMMKSITPDVIVDENKAGDLYNGISIKPVEFVRELGSDDEIYVSSMQYCVEMKHNLEKVGTSARIIGWKEHALKGLKEKVSVPEYYKSADEEAISNWLRSLLNNEVDYWDNYLSDLNEYEKKTLERRKFEYPDKEVVFHDGETVLDVGSGPLPRFGNLTDTGEIVYIPVDPLAYWYKKARDRSGYVVPIEPRFAIMENLTDTFGECYADKVIIQNAMDHSIDVLRSFIEAFRTLKIGGELLLIHGEAECLWEYWEGLHQWGFTIDQGDLIVIGFEEQRINLSQMFRDFADIRVHRTKSGEWQDYIYASFKKKSNLPDELLQKYDDRSFRRILIEQLFQMNTAN